MAIENENGIDFDEKPRYVERKRWTFFGLPFTFTKYTLSDSLITVDSGLFKTTENDTYMYKVQDVKHTATLIQKMFGLGTVHCYCGDVTDPELELVNIKHSKEIKNYLLKASEAARIKRRTLNVNDIGVINGDDFTDAIS